MSMTIYKFNEDKKSFGENLKKLMKEKSLTIEKLAEDLDCDLNTVKKWRTGERAPSIETLKKLSEKFKISIQELYLPRSIFKGDIPKNISELIKSDFEINMQDKGLTGELLDYIDYLYQKMLFSFITKKERDVLKGTFKYFEITKTGLYKLKIKVSNNPNVLYSGLPIKTNVEFDVFYQKCKEYFENKHGENLPYVITDRISEEILNEFSTFVKSTLLR